MGRRNWPALKRAAEGTRNRRINGEKYRMQVKVKLHIMHDNKTGQEERITIDEADSVKDVLKHLNIVKSNDIVIMVNGKRRQPDFLLHDGDEMAIFPMLDGG
jgi:sulfur carrier protein ThiS